VFCSVPEQLVVPSILVVAVEREQASAPLLPVVNALEVKSTVEEPLGRKRCRMTFGVPASALIDISTSVAESGTRQSLACGPISPSASAAPLSAPMVIEQPPLRVRVWGEATAARTITATTIASQRNPLIDQLAFTRM